MLKHLTFAAFLVSTSASTSAQAQSLPPVRPIGETVARSTEPLGVVSTAVPLPDGRVLVNDFLKRRVLMFDSTFSQVTVVADSTASTANAYGNRGGGLMPYKGDSALFIDPSSMSMLTIGPEGKIARVMAAPRSQDVGFLVGGPNGFPGFDTKGRMVYRAPPSRAGGPGGGRGAPPAPGTMTRPELPDSAPVVRFDLAARSLDTAGFFRINRPSMTVTQMPNGGMMMSSKINPVPTVDDWALLSDGTIAFVKGADYSINWLDPDGSKRTTGKVPYEWQRLDEDGKVALLDSVRTAMEEARTRAQQQMAAGGGPAVMPMGGGTEFTIRMGAAGGGGGAPPSRGGGDGRGGAPGGGPQMQMMPLNFVSTDELPDYRPAFTAGSSRGDLNGNLWVRTTSPVGNAGPIYFVINTKGEVIDRVQLPASRLIVGFARNGDVFMTIRDADGNARVERAKLK